MNLTNRTEIEDPFLLGNGTRIITGVAIGLQIVIALLAMGGNAFIVAVYTKYKSLQDSTSAFIINLGFTDLITGFAIFGVLALEPTGLRQHTYFACLGSSVLIQYMTLVSHSLILVTTLERYIGICKRESYSRIMTRRVKFSLIFCAWTIPFPMSFLPMFGFNKWEEEGCSFPQIYPKWILAMRTAFHFLQTGISMILYIKILIKARQLQRQVRPGPMQGINPTTARYNTIKNSLKSGRIIALVTTIFFASWLPYNISIIMYCIGDIWTNKALSSCFKLFGLANSVLNPFLYAWQKRDIRKKLKAIISCNKDVAESTVTNPKLSTHGRVPRRKACFGESKEVFEMSNSCARRISEHTNSKGIETIVAEAKVFSLRSSLIIHQTSTEL